MIALFQRISPRHAVASVPAVLLAGMLAACSGTPFKAAPVQERSPSPSAHEGPGTPAPAAAPPHTPTAATGGSAAAMPPRGSVPPPPNVSALSGLMAPAPVAAGRPDDPVAVATPLRGDGSPALGARLAGTIPPVTGQSTAQSGLNRHATNPGPGIAGVPSGAGTEAVNLPALDWSWPVDSPISGPYNDTRKGVDFTGALGSPVRAAAQGVVSYVGDSLRGYGRMVVLKHDKGYISVYAHNSEVLVKDGDKVLRGQKIALMGSSDSKDVVLHFELRHQGRPLDPSRILPSR